MLRKYKKKYKPGGISIGTGVVALFVPFPKSFVAGNADTLYPSNTIKQSPQINAK